MQSLKKLLFLFLFIPLLAHAQLPALKDTTLITPSTSFTPQWRYSYFGGDAIPQVYINGKYYHMPTNKYLSKFYATFSTSLLASKVVFTSASKQLTSTGIGTSAQFIMADGSLNSTVYAPLVSPAFTGTPTAPTPASNVNTTQVINGAFANTYYTPITRTITTTLPLTGGGDLSANRTFGIGGLTAYGTTNQVLGMNAAATGYEYKTITAGTNVSVTQGVNSITIAATGNPIVEITGTTQAASANTVYIPHNSALTSITMPTTTVIGSLFQVIGEGAGGWRLILPTGAVAVGVGGFTTTSGGSLSSTDRYCTITIRLIATNKFSVTTSQGTITPL